MNGLEEIRSLADAYMVGGSKCVSRSDHAKAMVKSAINLQKG